MLLFVTFFADRKFYKLLFTGERGKICYFFLLFFTGCNFDKLLFTVEKGQGLYCVCDCAKGELERVQVDFFPSFFLLLRGRSVTMDDIIYVPLRLDFGCMEAPWAGTLLVVFWKVSRLLI